MLFDIIILSNKRENSFFIKRVNKYYEKFCEFRNCISNFELNRNIKERFPDILLIFDDDPNKTDYKTIEGILSKYTDINIILCSDNQDFLEKQLSSTKRLFLETDFFEKNYEMIFSFVFENIENQNKNKYKNYPYILDDIIGNSLPTRNLYKNIKKSSNNKAKILLTGEMGNEYEDIAYLIHKNSHRKKYNFISYDIALNQKEAVKKIFGFVVNNKITEKSLLEYSFNGTIFIKNIHLLNKEGKEKFLLFLRNNSFSRLNSKNKLITNNKIITYIPSNEIEKFLSNSLNKELYDRLAIKTFKVPSIKERKEDFVTICDYLIQKICQEFHCENKIDPDLILKLSYLDWKGNMEEIYFYLKLLIKNSLNNQAYTIEKNLQGLNHNIYNKNLKNAKKEFEKDYIKKQLERFGGHITNTAKFIGMNRIAFHKKIKDLGIKSKKQS